MPSAFRSVSAPAALTEAPVTVPVPALITYAYPPSEVRISQQAARPCVLSDPVTTVSAPDDRRLYDEAALPAASETIGWLRGVMSKPNGAAPFEAVTTGSPRRPFGSTGKVSIRALARSVTTSQFPSGVKRTAAAPAAPAASARVELGMRTSSPDGTARSPLSVLSP